MTTHHPDNQTECPLADRTAQNVIWVMTTGEAGMRSQALGLAEALSNYIPDPHIEEKLVGLRPFWQKFPGHLCPAPLTKLAKESASLSPPWPNIIISCGRRSTAIVSAVKKECNAVFTIHIQNPLMPVKYFDCVIPMVHDAVSGENVYSTQTALHRITKEKLHHQADIWREKIPKLNDHPLLGVVLGGKTGKQGFNNERLMALYYLIDDALAQGASIAVTPSRRTEAFVKDGLTARYQNNQNFWFWDGEGDNPYLGLLALSDHLLVTADSVSMISEGLATGIPVHIFPLQEPKRRHKLFLDQLISKGLVRLANQTIDFNWVNQGTPIDETDKIAQMVGEKYLDFQSKASNEVSNLF